MRNIIYITSYFHLEHLAYIDICSCMCVNVKNKMYVQNAKLIKYSYFFLNYS